MNTDDISKKKLHALKTRQKICTAADQLFRKYGFENVSVDSIVEMAGVSKGGFYVHFDSKDALIVSFINNYVNSIDRDYKLHLEALQSGTAIPDVLLSLVRKVTEVITSTLGYSNTKAVYKANMTKKINTDSMLSYSREIYSIFNDVISQGMEQGIFRRDIPSDVLAKHCIMALRGLTYEWCIRYPDFDLEEQAQIHFKILLSGIKAS